MFLNRTILNPIAWKVSILSSDSASVVVLDMIITIIPPSKLRSLFTVFTWQPNIKSFSTIAPTSPSTYLSIEKKSRGGRINERESSQWKKFGRPPAPW